MVITYVYSKDANIIPCDVAVLYVPIKVNVRLVVGRTRTPDADITLLKTWDVTKLNGNHGLVCIEHDIYTEDDIKRIPNLTPYNVWTVLHYVAPELRNKIDLDSLNSLTLKRAHEAYLQNKPIDATCIVLTDKGVKYCPRKLIDTSMEEAYTMRCTHCNYLDPYMFMTLLGYDI